MTRKLELEGLIRKPRIAAYLATRRSTHVYCSVPSKLVDDYMAEGWAVVRTNKNTVRLSKPKPHGQAFEDEVWSLLAGMGFDEMNGPDTFSIAVPRDGSNIPPKQIDVFAKDECCAVIVECKAAETPKRRSLQKDIGELCDLRSRLITMIHEHYGRKPKLKVAIVLATKNIIWSDNDLERCGREIHVLRDEEVSYYAQHVAHIGPAARFQFLADLFAGQRIPGLELAIPALRGKMADKTFYSFVIEPSKIMRIAFVSHRAKADRESVLSYQRMLKAKRLNSVKEFIDRKGVFPTSIVLNMRSTSAPRFDKKSSEDGVGSDFGILHLPSSYKSAWIIDGQHRLYGYARSQWASKATVPVIAFENLTASEEAKMFVDINNRQVKVPRNILVELSAELHWDSPDEDSRLDALVSRTAHTLGMDLESPLRARIIGEGEKQSSQRPITLTSLYECIRRSALFGTVIKGTLHPGPLYEYDSASSLKRGKSILAGYLRLFADALPEHWSVGNGEGGYLCTNNGLTALMLLLTALINHLARFSSIHPKEMSPHEMLDRVGQYVPPVIEYFKTVDAESIRNLRSQLGYGGQRRAGFELMELVHRSFPTFDPEGLQDHIKSKDLAGTEKARLLMPEVQLLIRDIILNRLRQLYPTEPESWWWDGVPPTIRTEVAARHASSSSQERGELEDYFELIDYKKIAASDWNNFQTLMAYGTTKRGKDQQLAWFDKLNRLRNRIAHPERGGITDDEIEFLREVKEHLEAISVEANLPMESGR